MRNFGSKLPLFQSDVRQDMNGRLWDQLTMGQQEALVDETNLKDAGHLRSAVRRQLWRTLPEFQ